MSASINVLVVEEKDLLREKIAGILSREENISMVLQVSSYANLRTALLESVPDLVLGDFFEFNKFCKTNGVSAEELCPGTSMLLYADEYEQLHRSEAEDKGDKRILNVRRIQQEVRWFLHEMKQKTPSSGRSKEMD